MNIKVEHLSKRNKYKGILNNVSFELEPGRIYGIGGCKKSNAISIIRCLIGISTYNSGNIDFGEVDKDNIGVIFKHQTFIGRYSGLENLMYLAGVNKSISRLDILKAMVKLGINPDNDIKYANYTKYMKQQLSIACAIMSDPQLLLLEDFIEKYSEKSMTYLREVLKYYRKNNKYVLIANDNYELLELICDEVILMSNGTIVRKKRMYHDEEDISVFKDKVTEGLF